MRNRFHSGFLRAGKEAFLFVFCLFAASPLSYADSKVGDSRVLLSFLHGIEEQRYSWFGYSSTVRVTFTTPDGKTAECAGQLDYQRLNERVFMSCYAAPEKLAFILKTDDDRFSLYLPSHQTLYEGNIFDLEFTEEINSHIQPMDLYRALKPMPVLPESAVMESSGKETAVIGVKNFYRREAYIERRLEANRQGQVPYEIYRDHEGASILEIERTDYRKVKAKSLSKVPVVLPFRIRVNNTRRNTDTIIFFTEIRIAAAENKNWKLPLPAGTRVVELPKFSGAD
mgnify:CR=1 FL=1